ncbi:MAG: hypothetical protein KGK07_02560 [Chloroflexota bacterium]|nr:hypothetical protein [Chloroflexota bacterium]
MSGHKQIANAVIRAMIARAGEISEQPGHWWSDQRNNHDAVGGYQALGEEIWRQSDGRVDAFVHIVATVVAALRVAERIGARARVATRIVDSGCGYLSTGVYARVP